MSFLFSRDFWSGREDTGKILVRTKGQNGGRRGQGASGLIEEAQGGFLEEVVFELCFISWGIIAHR